MSFKTLDENLRQKARKRHKSVEGKWEVHSKHWKQWMRAEKDGDSERGQE